MSEDLNDGVRPMAPSNWPAVVSAITGLLLCIPGLGVVAIVSGLLGFRRARQLGGNGVNPARVGLVLGIVNLVIWASMLAGAYGTYRAFLASKVVFEPTKKFIMLVGSGNVAGAKALCTDAVDVDTLTASAEQIQGWGAIEHIDVSYGGEYHGPTDIEVVSELKFEKTTKYFVGHWTNADGSPRLTSYVFRDPPTTQPAAASQRS